MNSNHLIFDGKILPSSSGNLGYTSHMVAGVLSQGDEPKKAPEKASKYLEPVIRHLSDWLKEQGLELNLTNECFAIDYDKQVLVITSDLRILISRHRLKDRILEAIFDYKGDGEYKSFTIRS